MSLKPVAQAVDAAAEQPAGAAHGKGEALTVAEAQALPAVIGLATLARVLGMSVAHAYRLEKQGALEFLRVTPAIGTKRYSGVLVGRYVAGEPLYIPTFGRRKRA